jgi:ABC-type lipoprotein release transport system permease subunit
VYKIDRIDLDLRFMDVVWVIVSTLLICTASAFAPAWRGARMSLVEGLKNE